jgi:hypothetical protein
MEMTHRINANAPFLERTLAEIDVQPLSILRARQDGENVFLELTGDKQTVLNFT